MVTVCTGCGNLGVEFQNVTPPTLVLINHNLGRAHFLNIHLLIVTLLQPLTIKNVVLLLLKLAALVLLVNFSIMVWLW